MTRRRFALVVVGVFVTVAILAAGRALLRSAGPTEASGPPLFVDETVASGISQRFDGPDLYQVGGGVAVFDCNGDGKPDLYLAGGANPASLYRNDAAVGGPLRFSEVRDPATDLTGVMGAYPIDIDGDGLIDIMVLRAGENILLRGLGDCRFERANEAFGLVGLDGDTSAFSATWESGSTLPTLAVGHYLTIGPNGESTTPCADSAILRPGPGATRYDAPTPLRPGYCTLSMLFSDWDRSGRRDLRVTNDRHYYSDGMDQLWRMAPGEPLRAYSGDDGWVAMQIWGMGIASADITGDGYPEVFLTSQGDNKLQTLTTGPSQPMFRDIALKRGVTATTPFTGGDPLPSTAWHPEFADVNNDGFLDLFVSKGNVGTQPDYAKRDPSNLLLGAPTGMFTEVAAAAGIVSFARGRGAALADFNLDGLLDLVLLNYGGDTILWRNVGSGTAASPVAMGHWLAVAVEQPGPNRNAIGAWLEARIGDQTVFRELTIGGGHAGGQLGWQHLGLGPADSADIRVHWPDGELGAWVHVQASEFAIIERNATAARRWLPGGS
ncbi:MAG: VCBS repeat-containing protein [Chloroflexota bacterium]